MTKHIQTKHKIQNINRKTDFNELLEQSMLNKTEKQMMKMYYEENKQMDLIADELGYSEQGIIRMHKRILKKLESLL